MKDYLGIFGKHQHPMRFVAARALSVTGACRLFTIQQDGYRLRFHPANLPEQVWIDPLCRVEPLEFFRRYPRSGDLIIDVGANVGDTVLTSALRVGEHGHVWAIEPHPRTFRFLTENLSLNRVSNVEPINCAVGSEAGQANLSDDRRDDMNRISTTGLVVPVRRLDDVVRYEGEFALLKIDVEGYELPVVAGAHTILSRTKCIHFEVAREHFARFGYTIRDLLESLESHGFELFRCPRAGLIERIDSNYDTAEVENLIGTRDRVDFVLRTNWELV